MGEELPDEGGKAFRNLLGAVGLVLLFMGGEIIREQGIVAGLQTAAPYYLGVSAFVFMSAFLWRRARNWLGRQTVSSINSAAADVRWWVVLTIAFLVLFRLTAATVDWTWVVAASVVLVAFLASWRHLAPQQGRVQATGIEALAAVPRDPQSPRDLLLLLDFAVYQTTVVMLEGFIQLANAPEVTDGINSGDPAKVDYAKRWFIGHVGGRLGDRTDRQRDFRDVLFGAESEAERRLEEMPVDQRPPDLLQARRRAIIDLQFTRTIGFLKQQKREVEEKIAAQRGKLIERLSLRTNSMRS